MLLGATLGLWFLEMMIRRRLPNPHLCLVIPSVTVLLFGWFMVFNARAIYDTELDIVAPLHNYVPWLAGSIDRATSTVWMVQISLMIGALLFIADLALRPVWLLRLWVGIGVAGASIALLGLLQWATGAVLPFWRSQPDLPASFFATYIYHGNAGAFLNLVLAPTLGLAIRAAHKPGVPVQRALWLAASLLIVSAIFINLSRVAQLLGLLGLIAVGIGPARRVIWQALHKSRAAVVSLILLTALTLFAIAQAGNINKTAQRWHGAIVEIANDPRWQADKIALAAIPDGGWAGFGPGTFHVVFMSYWPFPVSEETGSWFFLHQDYLQTVLEWGWVGAACWAVIFFGGIITGFIHLRGFRNLRPASRLQQLLPLILIALGTVALHSLVDFPLQIASLQLYVATYLGLCWAATRSVPDGRRAGERK